MLLLDYIYDYIYIDFQYRFMSPPVKSPFNIIPAYLNTVKPYLSTMAHLDIFRQFGFVCLISACRFKVKIHLIIDVSFCQSKL